MRDLRPFEQLPFDELPAEPRVPHGWDAVDHREVILDAAPFGRHRVHFVELGEGEPLLLVHGLMWRAFSWRYVVEPLSKRFRVIAPDLPGAGRSDAPDVPYTPENLVAWLQAFSEALGIRGCRCIGNSMGGYLTMQAALADPGLYGRLVNLHGPGIAEAKHYALHGAMRLPGAMRLLDRLVARDPMRWSHRNVHYHDESLKSLAEVAMVAEPLKTRDGRRAFGRYLRDTMSVGGMRRFQATLEARQQRGEPFPVPLQLVYVPEDPMVAPWVGDALAHRIDNAQLVHLPTGSHFAHVDAVEHFLSATEEFLA
ncbi:MAG: alpha/beta hydrolase [Deltaproteobacteria bacterium]|nr:MAG: alpha/beta hydrolase [Deltaproteobacteria bacterium]